MGVGANGGPGGLDGEDRELVHSLRNCLSALKFGTDALERSRTDEEPFKAILVAMKSQLDRLQACVTQVAQRLEAPPAAPTAGGEKGKRKPSGAGSTQG